MTNTTKKQPNEPERLLRRSEKNQECSNQVGFRAPAIDIAHYRNWIPYYRRRCTITGLVWGVVGIVAAIGLLEPFGIMGLARWLLAVLGLLYFLRRLYSAGGSVNLQSRLTAQAQNRCHIVFFRRFSGGHSSRARSIIIPFLEGYGRVTYVRDQSFEEVKPQSTIIVSWDENRIPGEGKCFDGAIWKKEVQQIIDNADVAVFDISEVTDNLMFEITKVCDRLPTNRIILISEMSNLSKDAVDKIYETVRCSGAKPEEMHGVILYKDHYIGHLNLRDLLHETMIRITANLPSAASSHTANVESVLGQGRYIWRGLIDVISDNGSWPRYGL